MANRFLSNLRINDAYTLPASDGTEGQVISTDGTGNLSFVDVASGGAPVMYKDDFIGDGIETVFQLANPVGNIIQTQLYIDGVYQEKETYSVSGTDITFTTPPANGSSVEVISITGINFAGDFTVDSLQFTGGTGTQGTLSWNADEETLDLVQNGATLQLGQEIQVHVKNQTGSTIPDATPVYVTGTLGASGRLTVAPMIADGSIPAKFFLGITTESIADGEDGKVTTFGKIRGVDTSIYTEGQTLFVSASTAGAFQTTAPVSPNLDLEVAIVINSDANNGTLFVRAQNGYYLGMLHDVALSGLADKDLLVYNNTTGVWENSKTLGDITTGNITTSGAVDGVDISSFKSQFDTHLHDDRYYTETEIDQFFGGSVSITGYNKSNWDTAFGWGDHSLVGYLTTETDPVFSASAASGIASTDITNWNTAYGWGDHSTAGYLTSVTNISGYSGTLIREDNRTISPSELTAGQMKFGFTSWNNNEGAPYADFLHFRSYTDSSGGSDNLVTFLKSGIGMRIWQQSWGSSTPYSSYVDVWTSGNFSSTDVSNWNTAYGWGNHAGLYLPIGARYTGDASSVNVSSYRLWDVSTSTDAPSGALDGLLLTGYWDSSSWATQQYHDFHSNTLFIRNKYSGTWQGWKTVIDSSNIGSQSVSYASNAGTLDSIDSSQFLRSDTADTATGMITFNAGTRFPDTNGTINSLWGIYGWDTQLQFTKRNISTDGFEGIAMFLDYGGLYAQSDYSFRAPVFYDSNSTSYYLDPSTTSWSVYSAGGARFRNIQISSSDLTDTIQSVNAGGNLWLQYGHNGPVGLGYGGGLTTVYGGLTSTSGKNGRQADFRNTRTGDGTNNTNTPPFLFTSEYGDQAWGIVSEFRVDGNNTGNDRPSIKFSSGKTTTNWTVGYGYNDNNFRINQDHGLYNDGSNAGWGTNRFLIDTSGNVFSQVSSRSPIFYDSDNTGYYLDPSTSGTSAVLRGNIRIEKGNSTGTAIEINSVRDSSWPFEFTTNDVGNDNPSGFWVGSNGYPDMRLRREGSTVTALISSWERSFTTYGITDSTDMRAPVFYDSNDTSYYLDPNSCATALNTFGDHRVERGDSSQTIGDTYQNITSFSQGTFYNVGGCGVSLSASGLGYNVSAFNFLYTADGIPASQGFCSEYGNLYVSGAVCAFSWSDERLKCNIEPFTNALDTVKKINGVTFEWNDDSALIGIREGNKGSDYGFIAQNIKEVLPLAVKSREFEIYDEYKEYYAVETDKIVPVLVEAIKELSNKVEELERRLNGTN